MCCDLRHGEKWPKLIKWKWRRERCCSGRGGGSGRLGVWRCCARRPGQAFDHGVLCAASVGVKYSIMILVEKVHSLLLSAAGKLRASAPSEKSDKDGLCRAGLVE